MLTVFLWSFMDHRVVKNLSHLMSSFPTEVKQGFSKCSAEVLFSVPKREKTAMCLMEKIWALC